MKKKTFLRLLACTCLCCGLFQSLSAQTEVMAWSNITGVRVEGELMDFETFLSVGNLNENEDMEFSGKEKQVRPRYHRNGNIQEVITSMRGVHFIQKVVDKTDGLVDISFEIQSDTVLANQSAWLCIALPNSHYANARIKTGSRKVTIQSDTRKLEFSFTRSVQTKVGQKDGLKAVYVCLLSSLEKGNQHSVEMILRASGAIDREDVDINLDMTHPGNLFVGFGGNFRLQNPKSDPKVIDYCLKNLRVAYGRVELPWRNWQPTENEDPFEAACRGKLDMRVEESMLMAQRLRAQGIPVILSCWFPPSWAIKNGPQSYKRQGGVIAYKLDESKTLQIYKSLADYMEYAKKRYGVEFVMFSFNESDLGIDVLHSPQEHADFIKGFGAYLAKRGLPTRLLLGDNSDATTFDFILPALNDEQTHRFIGAVSFHSWRGCDDETLHKWALAARQLNVPLIIGEGSTDAAAHGYAEIFNESTFAFYEINLYVRICAICQPLSILQWQLTSDYSLLWGDGIYGSKGALRPTQRFWNIKQLASTPIDALAIPVSVNRENVNCAAFGNMARGEYAIHIVNNGTARKAVISGLPDGVKNFKVYVTNAVDCMKEIATVNVDGQQTVLSLPAISFITLLSTE